MQLVKRTLACVGAALLVAVAIGALAATTVGASPQTQSAAPGRREELRVENDGREPVQFDQFSTLVCVAVVQPRGQFTLEPRTTRLVLIETESSGACINHDSWIQWRVRSTPKGELELRFLRPVSRDSRLECLRTTGDLSCMIRQPLTVVITAK
jgi:hypothetical protein